MISVSWLDILASAIAASKATGRDISTADLSAVTLAAKGIESVLASSIESPGATVPMSFSRARFGAVELLAAITGKVLTLRAAASTPADFALAMPTTDGTVGQVLATDGTGNLHWVAAGGGGGGTVTSVATGDGLTGGPIVAAGTVTVDATVARRNAANTFTGLPQTVQHDAIGNTLIPTGDLVLVNTTAAGPGPGLAGYSQQQNSPGIFFLAEQWNGGASAQGGAALHFKPIPGTGSTGILQVSSKSYSTGNWERMFDFPSLGPFGFQEGVNYYAFRHKGINNFELGLYIQKLDGLTAGLALGRDAGTNSTYIRSLAAALPVYAQDSAGALTQLQALNFVGSGSLLTDLPTWYNNDAFMLMGA